MTLRRIGLAVAVVLPLVAGAGELIEYRTKDGRSGFVNHASLVPPGAEVVRGAPEPKKAPRPARPVPWGTRPPPQQVRRAPKADPAYARPARTLPARTAFGYDPHSEERRVSEHREKWVAKRRRAEEDLRHVQAQMAATFGTTIDACVLGAGDPCGRFGRAYREMRDEEIRLRGYLEDGLEEECRRAPDCLPGYFRDR